jgi:hypothetical protein
MNRAAIAVGVLVLAIGVAWATRYEHQTIRSGDRDVVIRINRYTGEAERVKLSSPPSAASRIDTTQSKPCTEEELRTISPRFIDLVCIPPAPR